VQPILPRTLTLAAAVQLALVAACSPTSDDASKPTTGSEASVRELMVSNARIVLGPIDGHPAAVYFDLSYTGAPRVSLVNVAVEGAGMTMIHDYAESAGKRQMVMADEVPLSAGVPISFTPGGLHVMAMEPGNTLEPGGTTKVTLTFSNGTKAIVEASVRAAGEER
jgi:copper(I)-binding protein